MQKKIIFPEAGNEYIKEAVAVLNSSSGATGGARRRGTDGIGSSYVGTETPLVGAASASYVAEPMALAEAANAVKAGDYAAIIAGVDYSSRDVILACRDQLGVRAGQKTFSSLFVCRFPDGRVLILSDGATCKNPTVEQLTDIVLLASDAAAKILGEEPRIAMLSFSTFGSGGKDPSMDRIRETIRRVRELRPELLIDGEMQLDAAVNPRIAAKKAPTGSAVAGRANVLIAPDINAGNILYKSLEQFAGAKVAGPILLGFNAPVSDLSRGSTVEDIVFTAECLAKLID